MLLEKGLRYSHARWNCSATINEAVCNLKIRLPDSTIAAVCEIIDNPDIKEEARENSILILAYCARNG